MAVVDISMDGITICRLTMHSPHEGTRVDLLGCNEIDRRNIEIKIIKGPVPHHWLAETVQIECAKRR